MRARGQATVELALGSIVFVTVLLVGIHFAEAAWISLKVQEAQTWALWETTHHRVQQREADGSSTLGPLTDTLDASNGVGAQAQRRYKDFSGLSASGGRAVITQALTQGEGMDVMCREDRAAHFEAPGIAKPIFEDRGAFWCRSEAKLQAIRMPKSFLQADDGSFFQAPTFRMTAMKVCGLGLPKNGACEGKAELLTNDWGFVGREETKECKLGCTSSPYRGAVSRVFDTQKGWGNGVAFAERFAGAAGARPDEFYFSYSGVESGHTQTISAEQGPTWNTGSPGVGTLAGHAQAPFKCFLGRKTKGCP
jgi:hypothetical protein